MSSSEIESLWKNLGFILFDHSTSFNKDYVDLFNAGDTKLN